MVLFPQYQQSYIKEKMPQIDFEVLQIRLGPSSFSRLFDEKGFSEEYMKEYFEAMMAVNKVLEEVVSKYDENIKVF